MPKQSETTALEEPPSNSTQMGSDNGGDERDLHEYGGGKAQYNPHWTNVCGTEITITVSNPTGVVGATDPELNGGGD